MKRILLSIILLLSAISAGYCENQSLQLSIKADKQVYEAGEDIIIHASLENISDKTVNVNKGDYLDWNDACRFFFKNEEGAECRLTYIGPVDIIITDHLQSKQLWEFGSYTIGLLKDKEFKWQAFKFEQVKGKDYSFIGKQTIYMKDYGLTSNAIIIEMKEKKSSLSAGEEITLLRKKISDIESNCTPKEGMSKEEVERTFGEGKPAPATISKLPTTATSDSPNRFYELCKDGVLLIRYKNDKVDLAGYLDPYTVKGRPLGIEVPIEEQLREARHRLQQMELIHSAYLERIEELEKNQPPQRLEKNSPLTLFIKSDKDTYGVGEGINLIVTLRNNSEKEMIVLWKYGGVKTRELNVLEVTVFGDEPSETIYIKPKETIERNIILKRGPIPIWYPGKCFITLVYFPPRVLDYRTLPTQEVFTASLTSNTITIKVAPYEVKEVSYSKEMDEARKEFEKLKKEWEKEVINYGYGVYSAAAQYWQGKAGQAIINMGKRALPFIIEEIKKGNYLFNYLPGRITGMVSKDWINWWEVNKNNPKWNIFISQEGIPVDVDKKSGKTAVRYGE